MKPASALLLMLLFLSGAVRAESCTVSAIPLRFAAYDPLARQAVDSYTGLTLFCDAGVPFRVTLDAGANSGGGFHPRRMRVTTGTATLDYNLYTDSSRTRVWGDGTGNTDIMIGAGNGLNNAVTVYATILPDQEVPGGEYTDQVIISIDW